jgi:hypothetical protein
VLHIVVTAAVFVVAIVNAVSINLKKKLISFIVYCLAFRVVMVYKGTVTGC